MAEEVLVIPPIRQSLEDLRSAQDNELDPPKTEKSWYLYWHQTGDRVNANTDKLRKLITYGAHGDRPPASGMPAGSLYMETDRGNVIYQVIDGEWHYLAGTMFGTLSPDQRPTDLSVNDAGFEFRGTDVARQFLWSQTEWIEATEAQYGTHSARPNPNTIVQGALYSESDRGGVLYQNIGTAWKYRAGMMFGTLSPDQKPTDLGVNDAGFTFRGTDVARQFMWSQSTWIETTEAQYGNHSARPNPNSIVQGALYCESDRSGVIYQNIGTAWKYRAGTMYGTLSPDQRPTDLGVNDGGFEFRGTDQQRHFIWSQTAWVEDTAATPTAGDVQIAAASSNLNLTTVVTPIPGTTLSLNRAGRYLITGNFCFVMSGADTGQGLRGKLFAGGADQGGLCLVTAFNSGTYTVATQQWIYTAPSAGQQAYLSASKDGGTGTSQVQSAATTITALWVNA